MRIAITVRCFPLGAHCHFILQAPSNMKLFSLEASSGIQSSYCLQRQRCINPSKRKQYFHLLLSLLLQYSDSMSHVCPVIGASSGFGSLTARILAKAGHIVYAGSWSPDGNIKPIQESAQAFTKQNSVDLRTVELDLLAATVYLGCNQNDRESTGSSPRYPHPQRRTRVIWRC